MDTSNSKSSQSVNQHTESVLDPDPIMRERSNSLGQLFISSENNPLSNLRNQRKGLSRYFSHFDREHNYFGQALSDSMDDLDSLSQMSDSGLSDASHEPPSPGIKRNTSFDFSTPGGVSDPAQSDVLKRNLSSGDLKQYSSSQSSVPHPPPLPTPDVLREKAQKKKLSHSMIWNWVKSQQVRIDENSVFDSPPAATTPVLSNQEEKHFAKTRCRVTMRDLNAIGPSGW